VNLEILRAGRRYGAGFLTELEADSRRGKRDGERFEMKFRKIWAIDMDMHIKGILIEEQRYENE
jgi:hypothetical protein